MQATKLYNGTAFFLCIICLVNVVVAKDFYSFDVQDASSNTVSLEKYRGKVSLVVNVASECGYTETTYKALTRLHDILSYGGYFNVLAFPCNQFGQQEPKEATEIVENITNEYGVEFPIFDKVDIIGENTSPAFQYLIDQSETFPKWNFYKYLVDGDGKVMNVWGTMTSIEEIFEEIQTAVILAENQAKEKNENSPKKDEL